MSYPSSYPRVLPRAIDNGKTRLISLRLTVKNAELLSILAGQSGTTMAKETNVMLDRYWKLMQVEDELRLNKALTEWMRREIAAIDVRNDDIARADDAVSKQDEAAALVRSRHDLHNAKGDMFKAQQRKQEEERHARENAALEAQRRALPGNSKLEEVDDEKEVE